MIQLMGRIISGGLFGWCLSEAYGHNFPFTVVLLVTYIAAVVAVDWPEKKE